MTRSQSILSLVAVAAALMGAACGNRIIPTGPSGNPLSASVNVVSFVGTLPVGGTRFYSFTVPQDGNVSLTLLSLVENGEPSTNTINIGIGVPQGTGCTLLDSRTTAVGAAPQFTNFYQAAVYCARVADVGTLTATATFALNIAYPEPLR